MTGPAKLRAVSAAAGYELTIERVSRSYTVILDAPHGKILKTSGCHCDCSLPGSGWYTKPDWSETLKELRKVIAAGLDDCEDPACDTCHPIPF